MRIMFNRFLASLICLSSFSFNPRLIFAEPQSLTNVSPHALIYADSVNVGVIHNHGKVLLIDSGGGSVLETVRKAGLGRIDWVLYTDHERVHCSGAALLKKAAVKIAVPEGEAKFFQGASEFWQDADVIFNHQYDFRPDLSVLRSSVLPDRVLHPGEVFNWEGLEIHTVATPGVTDGEVSYILKIDGEEVAFTGDLIYGPGKIWEFYKLQKPFPGMGGNYSNAGHGGYWAFGGAVPELKKSLQDVLSWHPEVLAPSHGAIMKNPTEAVTLLDNNLDALMRNYLTVADWRIYWRDRNVDIGYQNVPMLPSLPVPKIPAWLHRLVETSWYIQSPQGRIFMFDCGFHPVVTAIGDLVKNKEITGVDGIWISHYHDDHITSVNKIRQDYGAKVYAQQELVDILEKPLAYRMPCLLPESIHIDHPLHEGEVINWNGYKMTAFYFPGQTLYHDGLLIEHDGTRILMSGDSFANFGIDDYCSYNRNFLGTEPGYQQCIRLILRLKPDMLVAAHFGAIPYAEDDLQTTLALLDQRQKLSAALFPWDDPNFGLDPNWVVAYPFRQIVLPGQLVTIEAVIYNHSPLPRVASAELAAPPEWKVEKGSAMTIPPHTEGRLLLRAEAPAHPARRRDVLGVNVRFNHINLGECAVEVVDYLK
jgi:glyoxylase-like metal-dependent hydrolase (beta-lactamase superfamily II)